MSRTAQVAILALPAVLAVFSALLLSHSSTAQANPMTNVAQVTAGFGRTCAIDTAGKVTCWGLGDSGQLGDNRSSPNVTRESLPVDVCEDEDCSAPLTGVTDIDAGDYHTCAVVESDGVKCWGMFTDGPKPVISDTPVDVCANAGCSTLLTGVVSVSAGHGFTCAVTTDGTAKCWGRNDNGQLGNGTAVDSDVPVTVCGDPLCNYPLSGIEQLSAGSNHACALLLSGQVMCWGRNDARQLGYETVGPFAAVPFTVDAVKLGVRELASGGGQTCALVADSSIVCWGNNREHSNVCMDEACSLALTGVAHIDTDGSLTCAAMDDGGIKCWGVDLDNQLGVEELPADICADAGCNEPLNATSIAVGGGFGCAQTSTGGLRCWGSNVFGQLGDSTVAFRTRAVPVLYGKPTATPTPTWTYTPTSTPCPSGEMPSDVGNRCVTPTATCAPGKVSTSEGVCGTPTQTPTPCPGGKFPSHSEPGGCGTPTPTRTSEGRQGAAWMKPIAHYPNPAISGRSITWVFDLSTSGTWGCLDILFHVTAALEGHADSNISQDVVAGCEPREVTFTSTVTAHPGMSVLIDVHPYARYVYSDGASSSDAVVAALTPLGDFNCDGAIDSIDAALILQIEAGMAVPLPCTGAADVNHDGELDALDALLILQHNAGLLTEFAGSP